MAVSLFKDVKCQGYNSYYSYRADVKENSYSIVNNTSNVTIDFYINDSGSAAGFKNYQSCQFGIWVDDTKKTGGQSAATTIYGGDYVYIGSWTGDITHDTDGKKEITIGLTFRCSSSAYYADPYLPCQNDGSTSYPSGTDLVWSMGKVALTTIPRASSVTVANGTLGTAQTLTVTRYSTSFTHTITYTCGNASGTVCSKSSSTSVSFTPPIDLAKQNTRGTAVSITYTITTYSGNNVIGTSTKSATCSIPTSVKPTCSLVVSDAMEYATTYGGYIKSLSELNVEISASGVYGSEITAYKTTVDGSTYAYDSFITPPLKSSGTVTVNCTVTDSRGRTGTASVNITVLEYNAPTISRLIAARCNSDGSANEQGEYIKITFDGAVTSLGGANTATYVLDYKKSTESAYTYVDLPAYDNNFAVSSGTHVFAADSGSSYDIRLELSDDFNSISRAVDAPTGFAIMHWKADGTAVGIGKIAEESYSLDMGVKVKMNDHKIEGLAAPTADTDAVSLGYAKGAFAPAGYGLGGISPTLTGNMEKVYANGIYQWGSPSPSDAPFNYSAMQVINRNMQTATQIVYSHNRVNAEPIARRIRMNNVAGAWEYFNPPMKENVEYRTTEMFLYQPVFVKLIPVGPFPEPNTQAVYEYSKENCTPISVFGCTKSSHKCLPYFDLTNRIDVSALNNEVRIYTNHNVTGEQGYICVYYIKT